MFIQTDAAQIIAECPNYNLAVRLIAKNCGARELFYIERFVTRDGIPYGATVCGKTLEEWVWDNHQEFNDGPLLLFPDSDEWDQTHRNMTILALEMAKSGQATKGQFIYNRWLGLSKFNERSVANNIPHGKLSGTNEPPQNKQLSGVPGQSKTGAEILPSLCQSQNAGVAQTESPDAGTAQETERAQVCAGLSPAGQDQTKAVSSKGLQWVAPDASSGLQHAVESCVALPQTPPRAPSSGVIDPMRVLWHSQDSVVLDIAGHRLWIINGAITKALKQPCQ